MAHWTDYLAPDQPDGAYLSWKQVQPRVGISRTTAWRLQKAGDFPEPYVVSKGRVAYREREVEAWKASRGHRVAAIPADQANPAAPKPAPEPPSWRLLPPSAPQPTAARKLRPTGRRARGEGGAKADVAGQAQIRFEF